MGYEGFKIKNPGYCIEGGPDVLKKLDQLLESHYSNAKIFILADNNTKKYCLPEFLKQVSKAEEAIIIEIPAGEENKDIRTCELIWKKLLEQDADRSSLLINLGGGVIGDMGGFVAASFKRGIGFIQVPTTLLAQVDASIGGKTGIDFSCIKNQIGVFAYPEAVFLYPGFLKTLEQDQLSSGYAEIIKAALVADQGLWDKLVNLVSGEINWTLLIEQAVKIKNKIVLEDPLEKGSRKLLNFGHSIGHALESFFLINGKRVLHGHAVATGIICESWISSQICGLSEAELDEISRVIKNWYPPLPIYELDQKRFFELIAADKKKDKDGLNFTLLHKPGKGVINKNPSSKLIAASLKYYSHIYKLI